MHAPRPPPPVRRQHQSIPPQGILEGKWRGAVTVAEHLRKAAAAGLPGVREIIDAAYRMLVENVAVCTPRARWPGQWLSASVEKRRSRRPARDGGDRMSRRVFTVADSHGARRWSDWRVGLAMAQVLHGQHRGRRLTSCSSLLADMPSYGRWLPGSAGVRRHHRRRPLPRPTRQPLSRRQAGRAGQGLVGHGEQDSGRPARWISTTSSTSRRCGRRSTCTSTTRSSRRTAGPR